MLCVTFYHGNGVCDRLYGLLLDQDALQAIFGRFISTQPLMMSALEAETRGDLSAAITLYSEVLTCITLHPLLTLDAIKN